MTSAQAPQPRRRIAITLSFLMQVLVQVSVVAAASGLVLWGSFWAAHQAWALVPDLGFLRSATLGGAIWVWFSTFRFIVAMVPRHVSPGPVGDITSTGADYSGWNRPLMVDLTATTNEYLAPDLPLRGLLKVHEMNTRGFAQRGKVSFQKVDANNRLLGGPVHVDDAEFTYTLAPNRPV